MLYGGIAFYLKRSKDESDAAAWALALFAPVLLSFSLRDLPANRKLLGIPILPFARLCEAVTKLQIWAFYCVVVLPGVAILYYLISNATILGVLVVIALLLALQTVSK